MRIGKSSRIVNALLFALLALAILPMAITSVRAQAVCTIPGESCADFATNFVTGLCGDTCTPMPGCATCPGPLGLASDPLGNLYVADIVSDNIYRFSHTLGQIACPGQIACSGSNQFVSTSTLSPYKPHGMTFGKDGSLYVNLVLHTNLPDGEVVRLSPSGMSYQVVATGLDWPSGLASDPLTGDLFLSETAGPATNYIYRVSIATGTVTLYANTAADGLAFGPDGTLYAATPGGVSSINGTNQPQPATVTFITSVSCAYGVAISLVEGKPFLYTDNSCGGTITKVALHTLAQTNIVSGGSRGDFVTVGSDDCLYATQSDRVLLVANGVGNCPLPPLGPMFQNHRALEEQAFHNSAGVPIQTGGSIPRGSSVYDTAKVAEINGIVPTGNVTYAFYNNSACSGFGSSQTVTLSGGLVPNSPTQPALTIGQYSFQANYTGDILTGGNYFPSVSSCGYFNAALVTTTLFNSRNISIPLGASVGNGTTVHDTAIVSGTNGITPTGNVTYTFFNNGACSGTGAIQTVKLSGGLAPNSTTQGPLADGSYSFEATYSGDSNYSASTSACEPFNVGSPLVCITASATATSCPASPPEIGPIAVGSTFTVGVFVQNSDPMGGFMIYVQSDPTYLYPVSAAIGTLVASPFLTTVCVNGYSPSNSALNDVSCGPADPGGIGPGYDNGPGVVMTEEGASAQCAGRSTCSGMAFNMNYRTVAPIGSTNLGFPSNAGACMLSSVASPADVCVLVADAGGGALSENIQGATVCVQKCQSRTATTTYDASTAMPWSGTEVTGASAYDTATVTGATGTAPTSSVFYTYYTTPDCSGIGASESPPGGSVLSGGIVPSSSTVGPEAAGTHSFQAVYSGDSNYFSSTSLCEPFTVNKAPTTTSTVLTEAIPSYNMTLTVPPGTTFTLGALIHVAPARVGPQVAGFTMTGSVAYNLYSGCSDTPSWCVNSSPPCSGTLVQSDSNLAIGTGPPDFGGIRLYSGQYCFVVSYTGDSNYLGSTFLVIFNVIPPGGFGGGRHPFRM